MLRIVSYCSAAWAVLMSASASAASIVVPFCSGPDFGVISIEQLSDGMTMGWGFDDEGSIGAFLASCETMRQLIVTEATEEFSVEFALETLRTSAVGGDTPSFDDLKTRFDSWHSTSEIKPISAELCACLTKER